KYNYYRKHGGFGMNRLTPIQKLISTWLQLLGQAEVKKVTGILQQYITCNWFPRLLKSPLKFVNLALGLRQAKVLSGLTEIETETCNSVQILYS
ncbi:MAG: hypothetical protein ABIH35_03325, partial [Patescibacteria group bacterium]